MKKTERHDDVIAGEKRLAGVFRFIHENYVKPVTIAKIANLSAPRFHSIFRETQGVSPYAYILQLRLSKACDLLRNSAKSIEEISEETGFYDRYHLSKQFKKTYRHTPIQYRNQNYVL